MAMLGDSAAMADARHRAADAMNRLAPDAATTGIYSVPRDSEPPYTATSLVLAGQHAEAAAMTRRIISTAYRPESLPAGEQPTYYARTLLILALAAAGLGDADEASAAGTMALESGRVVWPTMVLAGRLAAALDAAHRVPGTPPGSGHATSTRAGGSRCQRPHGATHERR